MAYSKSLTDSAPKEEELKELDQQISGTGSEPKTTGKINFKVVIIVAMIAAAAVAGFYFYKKKKK